MRTTTIAATTTLLLALPAIASAQPGMTPYASPPSPDPYVAPPPPPEPKARLELSLGAASPKGDWKNELAAETSPSFGLQLGFTVAPNLSLFVGFRYVKVKFDQAAIDGGVPEELDLSHRELQLGIRYTSPLSSTARLFVEGQVQSSTIAASYMGEHNSESGVGLGARGGLIFMLDRKLGLGAAVSYTSADIEVDSAEPFQDTWLGFDGSLNLWF